MLAAIIVCDIVRIVMAVLEMSCAVAQHCYSSLAL